jgi:hypothetical protein
MIATDDEIYAIEYATCGAQTPEGRDELAKQAVELNRQTRAGAFTGDQRRGPRKQPNDHPWKQDGRALFESFRAYGKAKAKGKAGTK